MVTDYLKIIMNHDIYFKWRYLNEYFIVFNKSQESITVF